MLPVVLSVFQRHKYVPLLIALLNWLSSRPAPSCRGAARSRCKNLMNRMFGVVTLLATALLGTVIAARANAQRLMWLRSRGKRLGADLLGEQSVQDIGRNAMRRWPG